MNKLINRANRRTTVGMAALLISGSYFVSRLLGLLRDRLLASHFGLGAQTDAYTAAFRLPDLLFTLLISGAFAVAFIPVLAEHLHKDEREEAWRVTSSLLNILAIVTVVACAVIAYFADPLTTLVSPGFDAYRHELTVNLTRILLITPVLFVISSVFGAVQQAFNRFLFFALSGVFYNVGIIVGIIFFSPTQAIDGVAWGVVLGALMQAGVQILGLVGLGYRYHFSFNYRHKSVRKTFRLLIPRSIDQGIDQINYTVETIIGSGLAQGSLTSYYYANNLKNVPLVIFGNAIATAAFPGLAARAAAGDKSKLIEDIVHNIRLILFLIIPSALLTIVLRGYIVRLLFGFGDATTANVLGWFAGTIVFQSLFFLIARVFYALQDTKTPLYVSIVAIALNIGLSFILSRQFGVVGLSMAQSAVALFECVILTVLLRRRLGSIGGRSIWRGLSRILVAGAIMACAVYLAVASLVPLYATDKGFLVVAPKFGTLLTIAAVTYLVPCYLMRLREVQTFMYKLKLR